MGWESLRGLGRYAAWWLAALGVAVFVAWQGVSVVATQVTSDRPAPITPDQARATRARPQPAAEPGPAPTRPAAPPPAPSPGPATVSPPVPGTATRPGAGPATDPTGPTGDRERRPAGERPLEEPAPPPPREGRAPAPASTSTSTTTTTGPGGTTSTTTTTSAGPEAETRTYRVAGGSVALRFEPVGVSVVWADPAPGFEVATEEAHGNGVAVTFQSASQRSVVEGWWDNGPRDQVREDPPQGD